MLDLAVVWRTLKIAPSPIVISVVLRAMPALLQGERSNHSRPPRWDSSSSRSSRNLGHEAPCSSGRICATESVAVYSSGGLQPSAHRSATPRTASGSSGRPLRVAGVVTLRYDGQLHKMGVGRTHAGTRILMLVHDLHARIIEAATGELLRELTLDPHRTYHGTGRPPGPTKKLDRTHDS